MKQAMLPETRSRENTWLYYIYYSMCYVNIPIIARTRVRDIGETGLEHENVKTSVVEHITLAPSDAGRGVVSNRHHGSLQITQIS